MAAPSPVRNIPALLLAILCACLQSRQPNWQQRQAFPRQGNEPAVRAADAAAPATPIITGQDGADIPDAQPPGQQLAASALPVLPRSARMHARTAFAAERDSAPLPKYLKVIIDRQTVK